MRAYCICRACGQVFASVLRSSPEQVIANFRAHETHDCPPAVQARELASEIVDAMAAFLARFAKEQATEIAAAHEILRSATLARAFSGGQRGATVGEA